MAIVLNNSKYQDNFSVQKVSKVVLCCAESQGEKLTRLHHQTLSDGSSQNDQLYPIHIYVTELVLEVAMKFN